MSNTVITNYTDLNGPSTKADSSVVVIVNKDGSLSVDQNLLGTLMGTDGQTAGISVVRVGHEGKPDDATDSETEDDKIPHVTLSVDSYYDEPNSIIKYDSGAEMLQSLRIETRENSLIGFHNDHCYTSLTSPSQVTSQTSDSFSAYDESVIEISHTPPPKPVPSTKKITILEEQVISKGKNIVANIKDKHTIAKSNILNKPLLLSKNKKIKDPQKTNVLQKSEDSIESSSSISSSGESIPDRDSDSDYKDSRDKGDAFRIKKNKLKPRILKTSVLHKITKIEPKVTPKQKTHKNILKKENKEKILNKNISLDKRDTEIDLESILPSSKIAVCGASVDDSKNVAKQTTKPVKKEKKTPAHVSALLSDMTALFSTPDVIRRVSTDNKIPGKNESPVIEKKLTLSSKSIDDGKESKILENIEKPKNVITSKMQMKQKDKIINPTDKNKSYDLIPQLDDASLAQILQDTSTNNTHKIQPSISTAAVMNSPGLAGPLSPTLDLLGGLQPEEEGLTEDLLMHVAQLVESSENLQEVIDKQVLGKVDSATKSSLPSQYQHMQASGSSYVQTLAKAVKNVQPRKDPIEIVRRDGRVITLPPIEAPATRSSKRKSQLETPHTEDVSLHVTTPVPTISVATTPEPATHIVSKQYVNKKLINKKQENVIQNTAVEKLSAESQESWNSEDDPNRLWCICRQPHNNRFMICCDVCEEWFHGKCVNITIAMGQQMVDQGIEWRCPNCKKKVKTSAKTSNKVHPLRKNDNEELVQGTLSTYVKNTESKTSCIVCKKPARASGIYCSDSCILKHAQESLGSPTIGKSDVESGKPQEKLKSESRVIVYERKSGRVLAGPNAPTAENLKVWLQKNPTFEVVRPGTLNTIKPGMSKKKPSNEPTKIQTTLNFERIPRKSSESLTPTKPYQQDIREKQNKPIPSLKEDVKPIPQHKTPSTPKSHGTSLIIETPKASTSAAKTMSEPRKLVRTNSRSLSTYEKVPSVSPSTSRRKDTPEVKRKMSSSNSEEPIRDNVRKALQEQISLRMAEDNNSKLSEDEIQKLANETEYELHELFRDVGMKYKAKYRSLMFNIKDRKNLSLWKKICSKQITPHQLVRLSPEELASQELAQWRDKEAKHQLELIKKSELDLLAATKTYVLKTHKGEEVMEPKKPVTTELDPDVPVENIVKALNDSTVGDVTPQQDITENSSEMSKKHKSTKKRSRDDRSSSRSKKTRSDSKRDSEGRRSSRRKSELKEKYSKAERRSSRKSRDKRGERLESKDKSEKIKEKSDSSERSRRRSKPREEKKKRRSESKSRERSRSAEYKSKPLSRSRSYETHNKNKNDSTDSDSIERPKSAMLKEAHPEYDPHEPMITSAFSEEDLRKSREDVYDESYKTEITDLNDYDTPKSFSVDTNVILPSTTFKEKHDKTSEAESDQEPTSTVENSAATVWNGCINMVDVARFYVAAHEVSGGAMDLEEDLNPELDIVGRINPDTVWDYIGKMKKASNKDIVILRLQAANDEEKMQYIALYSYLSSRNRLGVVKVSSTATVKDFYIVPLPANTAVPEVLLPFDGPGIGEVKNHLLLAIVIRQRKKRLTIPKDIIPAKVVRESRKRSYTPPLAGKSTFSPPASPKRRTPLPLPAYNSSGLSTSVKDKIAASLASADDEAYSPGSSTSSGTGVAPANVDNNTLRHKMEELNRQIEEQKLQILKMAQADSSMGEDEAYSPSRPMTPPGVVPLADIALPSNLQEILATIKQRSETAADVDMRTLPLP